MQKSGNTLFGKAIAALALCAATSGFTACSDDNGGDDMVIWDVYPYSISMEVVDGQGNNLLDTKNANNVIKDSITALYEGQTYKVDTVILATRAIMPTFYGLARYAPSGTRNYILILGEFSGEKNVSNQEIIIDWKDGSKKDTITFSHTCTWPNNEPVTSTTVWLNHTPTTMPVKLIRNNK